ncbi:MAG: ribonuclease HII [Promethearchaeota archaeon]
MPSGRNESKVGETKIPILAGIEEAGRGPVIGPMVMAIAVIDSEKESYLREIGVRDSKKLSPKQRTTIFIQLTRILQAHKYVIISPTKIDAAVESKLTNLNWLEADESIELIKMITLSTQIDEFIIDCPSTNIKAFIDYFHNRLDIKPSCIIAEHKADEIYPIVSAASIIAKVIRDREIEKLHKKYQVDFGSGYPSDQRTVTFLKNWVKTHENLPDFVRKSWATAKNILNESKQRKLNDF